MALRIAAASATVRPKAPTVSCVAEMGMTPARLVSPTVGLIPTTPFTPEGQTIDPSVSVPIETVTRFAATAIAEPELEPQGVRFSTYGFRAWPLRALQPLEPGVDLKYAHSLIDALPRMTAPACRRRCAIVESSRGRAPTRARAPAVVSILSAVAMLSFSKMGMPCRGPRTRPDFRSSSRARAIGIASGLISWTECKVGPVRSIDWMRERYFCTSDWASRRPAAIAAWSSATPISSTLIPTPGMRTLAQAESSGAILSPAAAMPLVRKNCRRVEPLAPRASPMIDPPDARREQQGHDDTPVIGERAVSPPATSTPGPRARRRRTLPPRTE